jgi:hypothetical protein
MTNQFIIKAQREVLAHMTLETAALLYETSAVALECRDGHIDILIFE